MMQASRTVPEAAVSSGQACGTILGDPGVISGRSVDELEGEGLRRAGRSVTGCIWEDCRLPDPLDIVTKAASSDNSLITELNPGLQTIHEGLLKLSRLIVIPEMLISQYSDRSRCFMGLMAEIGRAWMTVDERLFLWDFKGARDVASWTGDLASGPIIDVQLVRPRPGVFVEAISWLLVVVTPVDLHVLGVQICPKNGDLLLHDTQLVFGSDQVNMLSTVGTAGGRIFCGGQDGHVYELEYEAEEGWFTRRCRKTCLTGSVLARLAPTFLRGSSASSNAIISLRYDSSRELVWALTDSGQIDCYSLLGGSGWAHQASLRFSPEEVRHLQPALTNSTIGDRLSAIHVLSSSESSHLALLAVTSTGFRLYYGGTVPHLKLAGVRAPQPITDLRSCTGASGRKTGSMANMTFLAASMASVHASFHRAGVFAAAGALSDDEDILTIRSARFPAGNAASGEASSEWRLEGKVWDMAEAPSTNAITLAFGDDRMSNWWADLVQGHRLLPRQFLFLTNAGIYVFELERPVDTLARILVASGGNVESEGVQAFFQRYLPTDQAIAVACVLATRPAGGDVAFWAASAAFRYAGEPSTGPSGDLQPSSLQMGLYRYAGRLVASVWKNSVASPYDAGETLVGQLKALSRFLSVNAAFIFRKPAPTLPPRTQEAYQSERASLQHLERLVQRTSELVLFLLVCHDYRLPIKALIEPGVDLEQLASSPVRGPVLVKELGSALVKQQLHLQASVESLCSVLRDRAPTFFSSADVLVYEGTDALERALKQPISSPLRDQMLNESLAAFLRAALPTEVALQVLDRYRAAHFWLGILSLGQSNAALHERTLDCLEDLLALEGDEAASVFAAILDSGRVDFLPPFYDWLFRHSIAGAVLLGVAPTFNKDLLAYLEDRAFEGEQLRSKAHADLAWKYLAKHGRPADAGRCLLRLARSFTHDTAPEQPALGLEERIQALSMAVATLKSCGTEVSGAEAAEAEEFLEVALVQLELLNALHQRPTNPAFEAQLQLNGRLFDLTTLFVEFSEPLGLPDISLLIVHTAGHADAVLVARLWQRVLATAPGADFRLEHIQRTLASLASKLWPSDVAFPLAYLVDMLALIAFKAIAEADDEARMASWFAASWCQTPVPSEQVRAAVDGLIKAAAAPESFWASAERKRFLRLLQAS